MKIAITLLAFTSLALFTASGSAAAQEGCSNATLIGDYAFTLSGQILAPPPAAGPASGVALTHFDGRGNMTQVDHVVHNGVLPAEEWRPGLGPYQVNPDCTGWMTITQDPAVPSDASPELKIEFVVSENGNSIHTVVSGSPTVPAFLANITSSATRVRDGGYYARFRDDSSRR
jgi:hypothetical protein